MSNVNLAESALDNLLDGFEGLDFSDTPAEVTPLKAVSVPSVATIATPVTPINPALGTTGTTTVPFNVDALAKSGYTKLVLIKQELNDLFLEREAVIQDAIRALITGQSMLVLGPPGTGKSALFNEICRRIVLAQFFSWLLNRTSDPAEILGPYSLKAMERDKFLRKTEGKLPEAHIAFIDEIWKCNEPTLNIMLPIINEKIFFNDGKPVPVPLISLFAASNELPEDESLDALYDRLLFRHWVDYIADAANKQKMYENSLDKRSGAFIKSHTTITLEEIKALQAKVNTVIVDKQILKSFIRLLGVLSKSGIKVSDRRQNECLKIMQGNAVMNGRDQVVLDDLGALIHVLWEKKEDITLIEDEIVKLINPYDDKLRDLMKKFKEIKDNLDSIKDVNDKCRASIEAKASLESIVNKLDMTIKDARKNGKDVSAMNAQRDSITNFNQNLMQEALGLNLSFGNDDTSPF